MPITHAATTAPIDLTDWNADHEGATRSPELVVAASDAPADVLAAADFPCNGTNDAAQIMAAVAALPAAGGTIILSGGTFNLVGQGTKTDDSLSQAYCVLIDEGDGAIQIRGQGIDATTLRLEDDQASNTIPLLVRGTDAARRTAPTLLTGFTIHGNSANNTWGDFGLITIAYSEQVAIDLVRLEDAPHFLLQSFRKSYDVRLVRCTFLSTNAENTVRFEHPNFIVTQCRFEGVEGASDGALLALTVNDDIGDWWASDGRVFANLFIGGMFTVSLNGASGNIISDNMILMGDTAQDASEGIRLAHWSAILDLDSHHNTIVNNRIYGAGTGIRLAGNSTNGSKYNLVAHNMIQNNEDVPNLFWGIKESDAGSDHNMILDNFVTETFFVDDVETVGAATHVRLITA